LLAALCILPDFALFLFPAVFLIMSLSYRLLGIDIVSLPAYYGAINVPFTLATRIRLLSLRTTNYSNRKELNK
jgi:hypothetical protein